MGHPDRRHGQGARREPGQPEAADGEIEVYARDVEVLGAADELPLPVFGEADYPEETRLKYRFLDLRREGLHANIMLRSRVIRHLRRRMDAEGSPSSRRRSYRVIAGGGAGLPGAVTAAPGQVLRAAAGAAAVQAAIMVAGFDRYFEIAPCFRDEDPRADRSRVSSTSSMSR